MAVVIYCTESNGYGDLLFGLKLCAALRAQLKAQHYNDEVYLVARKESIDKIKGIGGDVEFGVPMTTPENFNKLLDEGNVTVDYLISGPTFKPDSARNMNGMNECKKMSADLKIMLLLEYALPEESFLRTLAVTESRIIASRMNTRNYAESQEIAAKLAEKIEMHDTGFSGEQLGILISHDIVQAALVKRQTPQDFYAYEDRAWQTLEGIQKLGAIRRNQTPQQYQQTTNFTFEYSSQSDRNRFKGNTCEHFLNVQAAYAKDDPKNQDILVVGLERELKFQALVHVQEQLLKNGYTHIEFVDLENPDQSVILHDEPSKHPKVYRVFYAKTLPHTAMDALQLVSGRVIGLTGDQSFSEGISALDKIIVYECLTHKEQLYADYVRHIVAKYGIEGTALEALLKKLVMSDSNSYEELARLMHDEALVKMIFDGHLDIAEKTNLALNVARDITQTISEDMFFGELIAPLSAEQLSGDPPINVRKSKLDIKIDDETIKDADKMIMIMRADDLALQDELIAYCRPKNLVPLLHIAIDCNNVRAVEEILKIGNDIVNENVGKASPLSRAMQQQNNAMVQILLENGADIFKQISKKNKQTCYYLAFVYNLDTAVFLNPHDDINKTDAVGNNFIVYAVKCAAFKQENDFEWLHKANEMGADFLSKDANGRSLVEIMIEALHADEPEKCATGVETLLSIVCNNPNLSADEKSAFIAEAVKFGAQSDKKNILEKALRYCNGSNVEIIANLSGVENLAKLIEEPSSKKRPIQQWTKKESIPDDKPVWQPKMH